MMLARKLNSLLALRLCVFAGVLVSFSCSSKPTDLRSLAPADSLIYLETNDLGAALQPIVNSKSFNDAAKSKPDLSAVKGVQLAISVTGFETSENKIDEENSELDFKAHFVAIADTHAWQWQANSFAENQLGELINKVYGGGVELNTSPKDGGTSYVWTAEDGRKAFGFVTGSLIFFGNDESSIEKVQAVRRGEADPIAKIGKVPDAQGDLAVGYVSTEGIGEIANIVGAQKAKESGEESEVQSFIARVLPQLLRGPAREVTWTAQNTKSGLEDKLSIALESEVANVLNETFAPLEAPDNSLLGFAPNDAATVTQYNMKNPQIAWRSLLLLTQKLTDPTSGKLIASFSNSFFEPYGIKDGEMFLGSISPGITTVKYDEEDAVAVISKATNAAARKNAVDPQTLKTPGEYVEINDSGLEGIALNGDASTVQKCIKAHQGGQSLASVLNAVETKPAIRTFGLDRDSAVAVASVLSEKKSEDIAPASRYVVETRFNKTGMERKLTSEFGLIGSIIAMLASEEQ